MLDFDFKPLEEEATLEKGDKRLRWRTLLIIILTLLTMIFAYLYVATLQRLEVDKRRIQELQSMLDNNTLRDSTYYEFNPRILKLKGILGGPKQTSIILEDEWQRSYVLTHNSIIADWRVVVEGDSVWFESLENGEKIPITGGE